MGASLPFHDAHLHLQDPRLQGSLARLLEDLPTLGIRSAVTNGTHVGDWPTCAALARSHRWIIPSFGLHPWWVSQRPPDWAETLEQMLLAHPLAAVGEVGLDRWILAAPAVRLPGPPAPLKEQAEVLRTQLSLAARLDRPVTLHGLRIWPELLALLRESPRLPRGFLVHAYSGPQTLVPALVDLGAYFSYNAATAFRSGTPAAEMFAHLPEERILVETDAPAMPLPQDRQRFTLPADPHGDVNHPGNLLVAYAALAAERGTDLPALAATVAANHARLFGAVS
jgi:TatD DNase family protein